MPETMKLAGLSLKGSSCLFNKQAAVEWRGISMLCLISIEDVIGGDAVGDAVRGMSSQIDVATSASQDVEEVSKGLG